MAISCPSINLQTGTCRTAEGGPRTTIAALPAGVAEARTQLGPRAGSGLRPGQDTSAVGEGGAGRPRGRAASGRIQGSPGQARASHQDPDGRSPVCAALGKVHAVPAAWHRDIRSTPHPTAPKGMRKAASHSRCLGTCSGSFWPLS